MKYVLRSVRRKARMSMGHGATTSFKGLLLTAALGLALLPQSAHAVTVAMDAPGVNGFDTVDAVTWLDSKGLARTAYFAKSYPNPIFPQIMGYVTRLDWQPDAETSVIQGAENTVGINAGNTGGWGNNVLHLHYSQRGGINPHTGTHHPATTNKRDGFDFQQGPLTSGPHHTIFRVSYKQYTQLVQEGQTRPWVQMTVDWLFMDGMDHIVYAITADGSALYVSDGDPFANDMRSPYSLFTNQAWSGLHSWSGVSGPPDGQAWGDYKQFVTYDMDNWTYGGTNLIPYAWEWLSPAGGRGDAETAFVQTEPWTAKQSGTGDFNLGQDGSGTSLPAYGFPGSGFAYQMNYYDSYGSQRITWGMPFGSLDGGYGSTPPYQNFSLAMHLGKESDGGVSRLIADTEAVYNGNLTVGTRTGTLLAQGPEGSGNPTIRSYSTPGFNPVYRTWEVTADNLLADVDFDLVAGASYDRPVFVLHNFAEADPAQVAVRINGVSLAAGADYLVSLDTGANKAWVTILRTLTGNNRIRMYSLANDSGIVMQGASTVPSVIANNIDAKLMVRVQATDNGSVTGVFVDTSAAGGSGEVALSLMPDGSFVGTVSIPAGVPSGAICLPIRLVDNEANEAYEVVNVVVVDPQPFVAAVDTADGIAWQPDALGGGAGAYAVGAWDTGAQQFSSTLGGIDGNTVENISGGLLFHVTTVETVPLRLSFRYHQTSTLPSGTVSSLRGNLNGITFEPNPLANWVNVHNTEGLAGPQGWIAMEVDLGTVGPGTHEVLLSVKVSEKHAANEALTILWDDIIVLNPEAVDDTGLRLLTSAVVPSEVLTVSTETINVQVDAHDDVAVAAVTVDASPVGGPAALALTGQGGTAWTGSYVVPVGQPVGPKMLPVVVSDGDGNTLEGAIAMDILPDPNCADSDGDGICDNDDNCVAVANQPQADDDGDGQGDACDCDDGLVRGTESDVDCGGSVCGPCSLYRSCNAASDCDSGLCEDNTCAWGGVCTLGDIDGDGICGDIDNCEGCYNPTQVDADQDGLGECWRCDWCDGPGSDSDWDGTCDGEDNCPTTWNASQSDTDGDGIGDACES